MKCQRCNEEARAFGMSWFEPIEICLNCMEDEADAPNYIRAREEERRATDAGIKLMLNGAPYEEWKPLLNFPGIGLASEDREFLDARLASRRTQRTAEV